MNYKKYILKIIQSCFETGHICIEQEDFETFKDYEQALELLDLGPSGFYEEFKKKLKFDKDFIAEYGKE